MMQKPNVQPAWNDRERLMTSREVSNRLAVSIRTLWRMVASGRFPPPIRYNRKLVRWNADVVFTWLTNEGSKQR